MLFVCNQGSSKVLSELTAKSFNLEQKIKKETADRNAAIHERNQSLQKIKDLEKKMKNERKEFGTRLQETEEKVKNANAKANKQSKLIMTKQMREAVEVEFKKDAAKKIEEERQLRAKLQQEKESLELKMQTEMSRFKEEMQNVLQTESNAKAELLSKNTSLEEMETVQQLLALEKKRIETHLSQEKDQELALQHC